MLDSEERYIASMVLSGVGDALGYKNQEFEYCKSGVKIHETVKALGGVVAMDVKLPDWPISDDTVMHIATAEALIAGKTNKEELYLETSRKYKECMNDMEGRKPGPTSIKGCDMMDPSKPGGYRIPFNPTGTGCGAAMRSMCIGLRFPRESDEEDLISFSIEAGRMTHHHPTGYLGSLASAYLVALAVRGTPLVAWGKALVDVLPKALKYVEDAGVAVVENKAAWSYFQEKWRWYIKERKIDDGVSSPVFPEKYGVVERDSTYETFRLEVPPGSYTSSGLPEDPNLRSELMGVDGWAGRSGHDAPMIALDALLGSGDDWVKLCDRAMFHAGDSDSTGVIAAACYGVLYGLSGVPAINHEHLEYRDRLVHLAKKLHQLSHPA